MGSQTTHSEAPSRRARAVDSLVGRLWRLPPATSDYSITRGIRVPMRDGVELTVDHYAPAGSAAGTLLARGPYGRAADMSMFFARPYAARGYHVILGSSRGTFGSGGTFAEMVRDTDDGADTVAWLRAQPWFSGRLATLGASAMGFAEWGLLADPPPDLAATIVAFAPQDYGRAMHGTGAFALDTFLEWSDIVVHQEEGGLIHGLVRTATRQRRLKPALTALPLVDGAEAVLGGRAPWFREWASHPDPDDPYWAPRQANAALDRVQVPVLLLGGWQDIFLDQTLEQYVRLHERGVDVALIIGPWTHLQAVQRAAGLMTRETLAWLAEHVAGTRPRRRTNAVRIFVTGADEWRDLPQWPPPTRARVLYLQPGGTLGAHPPEPDAASARFTYDPANPTPTVGGRLLSPAAAGYRDTTTLEARSDVLAFTGSSLEADLEVIGVPTVELDHSSDNPNADVFVRLSEVGPRGSSHNVSETLVRRTAGPPDRTPLRLHMDAIAHRFPAGSRIRLHVSGGSSPRFDRNLGTGEIPALGSRMARSTHTIAHGASRIILPVAEGEAHR